MLGLMIIFGFFVSKRRLLETTAAFKLFKEMRKVGKVKFKVLFFALQVVNCSIRRDVDAVVLFRVISANECHIVDNGSCKSVWLTHYWSAVSDRLSLSLPGSRASWAIVNSTPNLPMPCLEALVWSTSISSNLCVFFLITNL